MGFLAQRLQNACGTRTHSMLAGLPDASGLIRSADTELDVCLACQEQPVRRTAEMTSKRGA
jgi:hypothetical protein